MRNRSSIAFQDVPDGGRAEVLTTRFPQRPRDFLSYREARLWAIAKEGDFGTTRANRFFLKVGSDAENFLHLPDAVEPRRWGRG